MKKFKCLIVVFLVVIFNLTYSLYFKLDFLSETGWYFYCNFQKYLRDNFFGPNYHAQPDGNMAVFYLYRPAQFVLIAGAVKIFGINSFGHRLHPLLIFNLNLVIIFLLLKKLKINFFFIISILILFAFHPIQSEVVALSIDIGTLYTLFFILLSIYFFIDYCKRRSILSYFISIFCFVISLFIREESYLIPFYIAFTPLLISGVNIKQHIKIIIPYFLILIVFIVIVYGYFLKRRVYTIEREVYYHRYIEKSKNNFLDTVELIPKKVIRRIKPYFFLNKRILHFDNRRSLRVFYIFTGIILLLLLTIFYKKIIKDNCLIFWFVCLILANLPTLFLLKGSGDTWFRYGFRYYHVFSFFMFTFVVLLFKDIIEKRVVKKYFIMFLLLFILTSIIFHYKIYKELDREDYKISIYCKNVKSSDNFARCSATW